VIPLDFCRQAVSFDWFISSEDLPIFLLRLFLILYVIPFVTSVF
jgi:hypothetical protein